tara:strand:+ start:427 stop:630 length:204 start_codon:yes stop_codon:yes gene_type:complete
MVNKMKIIFLTIIYSFICINAHAYIDPGTGGIIIQAILGAIATVSIFFSNLRNKIKDFFTKKFKKKK